MTDQLFCLAFAALRVAALPLMNAWRLLDGPVRLGSNAPLGYRAAGDRDLRDLKHDPRRLREVA
ncbi:MAG: hypothetical protein WBA25_04075 [Jannaschia sp.]